MDKRKQENAVKSANEWLAPVSTKVDPLVDQLVADGKQRVAAERSRKQREICMQYHELPDGYQIACDEKGGRIMVLSSSTHKVVKPTDSGLSSSRFTKEQYQTLSGFIMLAGTQIVRELVLGQNMMVAMVWDGQGKDTFVLTKPPAQPEQGGKAMPWYKAYIEDDTYEELNIREFGIPLSSKKGPYGTYSYVIGDTRYTVCWNDTIITELFELKTVKTKNGVKAKSPQELKQNWFDRRFAQAESVFDSQGRLSGVYHGDASDRKKNHCLVRIDYKPKKVADGSEPSLTEQIKQICFDEAQQKRQFVSGDNGFSVRQVRPNGSWQYLGTIREPKFSFDEFGNLTYEECLFDERKQGLPDPDEPVYKVTMMLHGFTIRQRIK